MPAASRVSSIAVAVVAVLVLGACTTTWLVLERGLFQDDAQVLFEMRRVDTGFLHQAWEPLGSPTRRLQGIPYALALRSGDPLNAVRGWTELLPALVALATLLLARVAAALPWRWAFLAGALAATASGDWLTASPVAIGYQQAILLHVCGALGLAWWAVGGRHAGLAAGLVCGVASLWTIDAATTTYPFTPLVALLAARDAAGRRRARTAAFWWLALAVPYYVLFVGFLFDDTGYAAVAVLDRPWWHRAARLVLLVLNNLTPWWWAIGRGEWFGPPTRAPLLPTLLAMTLGLSVTGLAAWWLGRKDAATGDDDTPPDLRVALLAGAMAVLANATYMSVQGAYLYYRTNLHARAWTALALSVALAAYSRRGGRARWIAAGVVALFIGGGIAGGVERQYYFRDAWTRHRVELTALGETMPAAPAHLVLVRDHEAPQYVATQVPYLARFWAGLLNDDISALCRVTLLSPTHENTCAPQVSGLACEREYHRTNRMCGPETAHVLIPWDRLVVATFDDVSGRYVVTPSLPAALSPTGDAAAAAQARYAPAALVPGEVRGTLARQLLELPAGTGAAAR